MRRGTHITTVGSNACPMELPCFSQALSNTVMLQWRRRQSSTRPLLVQTSELAEETQLFRCMLALSIPNACSSVKAQKRLSELIRKTTVFRAFLCRAKASDRLVLRLQHRCSSSHLSSSTATRCKRAKDGVSSPLSISMRMQKHYRRVQ